MKKLLQHCTYGVTTAVAYALSYASTVAAQGLFGPTDVDGLPGESQADESSIRDTVIAVVESILNFLGLLAVIIIIIAGIRLIVSQGEEEQKEKAKKTIFYALIGLIVILLARVIVGLVTVYLADQVGAG